MLKINLDTYLSSQTLLLIFDVLLNEESIKLSVTKESLLKDIGINPSSFRRSRVEEKNIGNDIAVKLAKYFNLKIVNEKILCDLAKLIEEIYHDINYKVFEKFDFYTKKIEWYLSKNLVIFPVVKLLKLFIEAFSLQRIEEMIEMNNKLFIEISSYKVSFNDSLMNIYNILKLIFSKELTNEMLSKKYNNGICYSIIASRHRINKRYFESLYFAQKAKEMFVLENNLKRILYINFTILNDLSLTDNYEEYYYLTRQQLLTIRSFGSNTIEYESIEKHLIVSSLALKMYDQVIEIVEKNEEKTITDFSALVVAKYNVLGEKFDLWYDEEIKTTEGIEEYLPLLKTLIEFLKTSDKKLFALLEENKNFMSSFLNILKKT